MGTQVARRYSYYRRQSVTRNCANAANWWQKACSQMDTFAQNNLGVAYEKGLGICQSYVKAAYWLENAAERGYAVGPGWMTAFRRCSQSPHICLLLLLPWHQLAVKLPPTSTSSGSPARYPFRCIPAFFRLPERRPAPPLALSFRPQRLAPAQAFTAISVAGNLTKKAAIACR